MVIVLHLNSISVKFSNFLRCFKPHAVYVYKEIFTNKWREIEKWGEFEEEEKHNFSHDVSIFIIFSPNYFIMKI